MPRPPRLLAAGYVFHVFNRGVRRLPLFAGDDDYRCFQGLMGRSLERCPVRLLAYCLMPNHWHLVLWPEDAQAIPAYMKRLTWSHSCYYNSAHGTSGHSYEGRYRSVGVRDERQLLTLLRYVEGNAVRAGLVARAEQWRWSSLHRCAAVRLAESPIPRPDNWLEIIHVPPEPLKLLR